MKTWATCAFALASLAAVSTANAQDQELTLCWAAWDPANALVELSKDFTAETGIKMNFEFVPWTNFADRMLNELNSGGQLCDLMIGDSQWIGGGATYGHYVKLNDFFAQEGISMDDFLPAAVYAYSTWPKGSDNYYALPAMGDALGWVYRKDWFEKPELREAFQSEYGRPLAPPKDWNELMDIAKFFQGREIDGKLREDWDKLEIIHCGIEPARYAPSSHGGQSLLFTGRLAGVKGVPVLLEALAEARKINPELIYNFFTYFRVCPDNHFIPCFSELLDKRVPQADIF